MVRALPSPDIIFCERGLIVWMPGPRADIARAEAAISTWGQSLQLARKKKEEDEVLLFDALTARHLVVP